MDEKSKNLQGQAYRQRQAERALKESEIQLREVFAPAPVGMVLMNLEGCYLHVNEAFCRITGYSEQELLRPDSNFQRLTHPEDLQDILDEIKRLIAGEIPAFFHEKRYRHKDGSIVWVRISASLRRNAAGEPNQIMGLVEDISQRKRAEEGLRRSEQKLRDILNNTIGMIGLMTPEGTLIEANRAALEGANLKFEDILGKPFEECYCWTWSPEVQKRLRKAMRRAAAGRSSRYDEVVRVGEGEFRTIDFMLSPLLNSEGRVSYLIPSATDITERKRAEEACYQLNETLEKQVAQRTELAEFRAKQLRKLVSELTLAEQRERKRMAHILHDHLQQFLAAAKMNSEVLSARIDQQHKRISENILKLLDESIKISRSLTAELSPPVLRQGRLSAALEWLAHWMQETHGLAVELEIESTGKAQQEEVNLLIFQSVRELLFNVVKHAGVKAARVEMSPTEDDRLKVSVIDQGVGFVPNTIWTREGTGFGLLSMRERIELLGGQMKIISAPGQGATFSLIVPVKT